MILSHGTIKRDNICDLTIPSKGTPKPSFQLPPHPETLSYELNNSLQMK